MIELVRHRCRYETVNWHVYLNLQRPDDGMYEHMYIYNKIRSFWITDKTCLRVQFYLYLIQIVFWRRWGPIWRALLLFYCAFRPYCGSILYNPAFMTRLLAFYGFLVFSLMIASGAPNEEADGLNIILITTDDMGLNLGCYGDQTVGKPHLDRLAREGVLFTEAYVTQASCSPSRIR